MCSVTNDLIEQLNGIIQAVERLGIEQRNTAQTLRRLRRKDKPEPGEVCPLCNCRMLKWPAKINPENGHIIER